MAGLGDIAPPGAGRVKLRVMAPFIGTWSQKELEAWCDRVQSSPDRIEPVSYTHLSIFTYAAFPSKVPQAQVGRRLLELPVLSSPIMGSGSLIRTLLPLKPPTAPLRLIVAGRALAGSLGSYCAARHESQARLSKSRGNASNEFSGFARRSKG